MKNSLRKTTFDYGVTNDINHKNFFDNENPKRYNDDGRVSYYDDDTYLSSVYQNNDDFGATSIDENTHPEGNVSDETDLVGNCFENSEFNSENEDLLVNTVRSFASSLNKSIEPTCYKDAILDSNWIDAMNVEIEALN
ncbi:hypothetical protein Tco_0580543 [Tanacetum coccineum]